MGVTPPGPPSNKPPEAGEAGAVLSAVTCFRKSVVLHGRGFLRQQPLAAGRAGTALVRQICRSKQMLESGSVSAG